MPDGEGVDNRLELAFQLLRSVLEAAEAPSRSGSHPWQEPFLPPISPDDHLSATDLLTWWFRPDSTTSDPWDDYFRQSPAPQVTALRVTPSAPPSTGMGGLPVRPARPPLPGPPVGGGAAPPEAGAWLDWRALAHEPGEDLADDQADAAVTCLYDFLHALGRRDVEAALSYVAEDYHTLEEDREIDRLGLRQQVESLLDSLRGWELAVSLAEVPEALSHPYGILVYAEIQIDAHHPLENLRRALVDRRLVLLTRQGNQGWAIAALSRV